MKRQSGRMMEGVFVVAGLGVGAAIALSVFSGLQADGRDLWQSLLGAAITLVVVSVVAATAFFLIVLTVAMLLAKYDDWQSRKKLRRIKVPCGKFRGERGVVVEAPDGHGLIWLRLKNGALLPVPVSLFTTSGIFNESKYAWIKKGARVRVPGHDVEGRVEERDSDTHAVLVIPDGERQGYWYAPDYLQKTG
jgi:hypothetical protein